MAATNKSMRFFDLKPDTRDGKTPHFQESIPDGKGGYRYESYNSLSGILIDAFLEQKKFEGEEPYNAFKLVLLDGSETIRLGLKPTEAAYSILSRLGNSKPGIPVELEVRKGKTKSGHYYCKSMVMQDGENLEWDIDITGNI